MKRLFTAVMLVVLVCAPLSPSSAQSSSDLREKMLILEDRQVNVDFKQEPLADVLKFLSDVSGVSIIVAPVLTAEADDHDLDVTLTLTKVSIKSCLDVILDLKNLKLVYRHSLLMVTTPKDARGKPKLQIYSIGDLTARIRDFPAPDIHLRPSGTEFQEPEEIIERPVFADADVIQDLVIANCSEETWDDEGVSIVVDERKMVVKQYPEVHREIVRLLDLLRAYR
jgi:hypothetical protein